MWEWQVIFTACGLALSVLWDHGIDVITRVNGDGGSPDDGTVGLSDGGNNDVANQYYAQSFEHTGFYYGDGLQATPVNDRVALAVVKGLNVVTGGALSPFITVLSRPNSGPDVDPDANLPSFDTLWTRANNASIAAAALAGNEAGGNGKPGK